MGVMPSVARVHLRQLKLISTVATDFTQYTQVEESTLQSRLPSISTNPSTSSPSALENSRVVPAAR